MAVEMLNGVNTAAIEDAVRAIEADPDTAKFKFRLRNEWITGGHNQAETCDFFGAKEEHKHSKCFEWESDEPVELAGSDLGPNPVEHLLNALAACLTTTMVYHAALRGIKIDKVEAELEGNIDLRGFLGLSDQVRRGYKNIKAKFRVQTDADNLDRLKALSKLSPVFDVTSNGTQIDIEMERI